MLKQEKKALEEQLERYTRQSRGHEVALLTSIPGIGTRTACHLLAELGDIHRFANARKLVAFAGLTPARFESGTSVGGHTAISRLGSSSLRRMLYMPSLAAIRFNPVIKADCPLIFQEGLKRIGQGRLTATRSLAGNVEHDQLTYLGRQFSKHPTKQLVCSFRVGSKAEEQHERASPLARANLDEHAPLESDLARANLLSFLSPTGDGPSIAARAAERKAASEASARRAWSCAE